MEEDFEEFLYEELNFSEEEKDVIFNNLQMLKDDKDYELLKRKFYHELEGFDLEIELIEKGVRGKGLNDNELIQKLKLEKQVLINSCGFIFGYKE